MKRNNKIAMIVSGVVFGLCALPMTGRAWFRQPAINYHVEPGDASCFTESNYGGVTNSTTCTAKKIWFPAVSSDDGYTASATAYVKVANSPASNTWCKLYASTPDAGAFSGGVQVPAAQVGTFAPINMSANVPSGDKLFVVCLLQPGDSVTQIQYDPN